jgi:hypothetical protein
MTINFSDSRFQFGALTVIAIGASFWTGTNPPAADIHLSQQRSVLDAQLREASNINKAAERRAPEALERLKNGCTIMVLKDRPWISPTLTEGQLAVDSDGIEMQEGFVCTTTHTGRVSKGQVFDVIPVPPADTELYLETLALLEHSRAQRFQQTPTTH